MDIMDFRFLKEFGFVEVRTRRRSIRSLHVLQQSAECLFCTLDWEFELTEQQCDKDQVWMKAVSDKDCKAICSFRICFADFVWSQDCILKRERRRREMYTRGPWTCICEWDATKLFSTIGFLISFMSDSINACQTTLRHGKRRVEEGSWSHQIEVMLSHLPKMSRVSNNQSAMFLFLCVCV